MGKGFKGKTCVYCATAPAATMDPPAPQGQPNPEATIFLPWLVSVAMSRRARSVHHAQHRRSAGFQEPPDEQSGQYEKDDIEPSRVIPNGGCLNDARVT